MDKTITIPGRAYPARSSRQVPATLSIGAKQVLLLDDSGETIAETPAEDFRFDAPIGRAARRVRLPDGTLFETDEIAAADTLQAGSFWHRLHVAERFSPWLLVILAAALVAILAVWRFALPALVWIAVAMTPDPLRDAIDAGTLESMDLFLTEPTQLSQAEQEQAKEIFDDLMAALPEGKKDGARYTLLFRNAPIVGPNAFALPGGTLVLTDALVRDFNDPDIIAGVIGHEIGHVAGDHSLTQLYRSIGVYVLIALVAGDTGPILEDLLLEGSVLLSLSYSRAHERDADDFGIRLADRAGYDPAGLISFFEALPDAAATDSGWDSTHPASGERIEAIRDFIRRR